MAQPGRVSSGDLTGRTKAKAQREQREAIKERQGKISMADAEATEEEIYGVFDARTGERLNEPDASSVAVLAEPEPEVRFGREVEPVFTGKEPPEVQDQAPRPTFHRPAAVALSPFVTIRIDQDIEDMTYGMVNGEPNNFTFKEGYQYRVPRDLAEHLAERDLIRQWITT